MEEDSVMERSVLEPVLLGVKSESYPTTRPDGSALQTGDFVAVLGTNDIERYINGKWILNASVWQNTNTVPVVSPEYECFDSTAKTQYDANISLRDTIGAYAKIGQVIYDTESTEAAMKSKYKGSKGWEKVLTDYGYETFTTSGSGFTTIATRNGLHCMLDTTTTATINFSSVQDLQIGSALPATFSVDNNLRMTEGHSPAYGFIYHWADVKRIGPMWFSGNGRVPFVRNCSGTSYTGQTFRGTMTWNAEASANTPVGYYWKRTA